MRIMEDSGASHISELLTKSQEISRQNRRRELDHF
jgi:hypothetical protein